MQKNQSPQFIPGLVLNEAYYRESVKPILNRHHPELPYSAALIGFGSDVLGFDTPMSRDHMWGPRMVLFLEKENFPEIKEQVDHSLQYNLPYTFMGYPTSFGSPDQIGVRLFKEVDQGPVYHLIEITTIDDYFDRQLGKNRWKHPDPLDWLVFSEHILLSLTGGAVFHDDLGLEKIRANLAYFPQDVWLYQMASAWSQIGQEEHFVGRTGVLNDHLGASILTARIINVCMRLAFLQERTYAPYSKWFGTAFQKLNAAPQLTPLMQRALTAQEADQREEALCQIYESLLHRHNQLGLGVIMEEKCSSFHGRPFLVIHAERVAAQLQNIIGDEQLKEVGLFGSVNQFSPCCDLLENVNALSKAKAIYQR